MAIGHLLTGVAVLGLMAQPALAQSQDPATQQQPGQLADVPGQLAEVDVEFANEAAQGGLMELRFSELAQQQAKSPEVKQVQPEAAMAGDQADRGMVSFEDVLGSTVVNSAGEEIAEIDEIVAKDQTSYAVMSVGGFLGIGDKDVAIPLDQLKRGEGSYLMSPEIEEQLQDMPEYEETQYQPLSR